MLQSKPRRPRRPTKLEKALEQVARLMADREAASVPWPQLQEVRENYVAWEALTLWVRAIEDVEGSLPRWLAEVVERCCPGFSEFVAKRQQQRSNSSPFWHHLQRWINERIFHKSWQEGWMDAVGYYAARDLASLRNHAYWEYCEREWKLSKPAAYPSFRDWLKASEQCDDQALDECEMREEKRRLIKLSRRVSPRALRNAVTRYLEWEAFAYWARTALEVGTPLPRLSGEGSQQKMSVSCGGMPPHGAPTRKNNRTVASTGLSTGSRTTSLLVPRSEAGSMCLSTRRICIRGMPV